MKFKSLWIFLALMANKAHAEIRFFSSPWLRLPGEAVHLKVSKGDRFLAYTDKNGHALQVIDMHSKKVYEITEHQVGDAFFFSPDGYRIFYRELLKTKDTPVVSRIKAYDGLTKKNLELKRIEGLSGFLTFDPRDLRYHLMYKKGILSERIVFPDHRMAKWQLAQRTEQGKWLATPGGILWLTHSGLTMRKVKDHKGNVTRFAISPDGTAITWSTTEAEIFVAKYGKDAEKIGEGFDPSWHPKKELIVYAGARYVGDQIVNTDLRIVNPKGEGKWITASQAIKERFPQFVEKGQGIVFLAEGTTDLFKVSAK